MPCALLSVYNKSGLIEFANGLISQGFKLLASGSTAQLLRENNLPVTDVSEYTQSPEMLNGRVKTLHPAIHASILARSTAEDHQTLLQHNWDYIDLVIVNLYPFQDTISKPNTTLAEAIEQIDIGGVTLIRAAAKNFHRVTLVCDPEDYTTVLNEIKQSGNTSFEIRKQLAVKGFSHTAEYDAAITQYLDPQTPLYLKLYPNEKLRYGENPHQSATLYSTTKNNGPLGGKILQGKALSYNNLLDLDAAFRAVTSYTKPTICIVKHLSPCGIASADTPTQAFKMALECDPISAFGGIIACNKILDENTVNAFGNLFIECIAAPDFTPQALDLLKKRPNCRLLKLPKRIPHTNETREKEWRSIHQGILCQDLDCGDPTEKTLEFKVVTNIHPTDDQLKDLQFAWLACQHVKSNAIVFAKNEAAIGIGGGQPNRIDCVRMAAERAGEKSRGAVMASDAFFPFNDTVLEAAKHGITAIIQPGGSVRDAEVIDAANKHNIAMILTGVRHFRH